MNTPEHLNPNHRQHAFGSRLYFRVLLLFRRKNRGFTTPQISPCNTVFASRRSQSFINGFKASDGPCSHPASGRLTQGGNGPCTVGRSPICSFGSVSVGGFRLPVELRISTSPDHGDQSGGEPSFRLSPTTCVKRTGCLALVFRFGNLAPDLKCNPLDQYMWKGLEPSFHRKGWFTRSSTTFPFGKLSGPSPLSVQVAKSNTISIREGPSGGEVPRSS